MNSNIWSQLQILDDRRPGSGMLLLLLLLAGCTHTVILLLGLTINGGPNTPVWEMVFAVVCIASLFLWRFTTLMVQRGIVRILMVLVCARWTVSWMLSGPSDVLPTTISGLLYLPLLIPIARLLGVGFPFVFGVVTWMSVAATAGSLREGLSDSNLCDWRVGLAMFCAMALFIRFQDVWVKHLTSLNNLSERHVELARVAYLDDLTGLMSRRLGQLQMQHSILSQRPTSCLMADLDDFKSINDNFGHPAGDTVLRRVANLIRHSCRSTDTICRWGGEEFLVILDNTSPEAAIKVAEKIRRSVERGTLHDNIPVTISIGVAHKRDFDTFDSLMNRADKALYEAKISGRNRVEALNAA